MNTWTQLATDPTIGLMVACLTLLLALFPVLAIVEALGRDVIDSLPDDTATPELPSEPWPARQTPTDLAAAYDDAPTVERHLNFAEADCWATRELFWIKAVEQVSA